MRLFSNTEDLIMDGTTMFFTRGLTKKIGHSRFSKLKMETALVASPHSLGITGRVYLTGESATTMRFSSISPAPAYFPPNTLDQISTAIRIRVLYLVDMELGGN